MDRNEIESSIREFLRVVRGNPRYFGGDGSCGVIIVNASTYRESAAPHKELIGEKLDEILSKAEISDGYRQHLHGNIISAYSLGAPIRYIEYPLEKENYGIFDKERSRELEKKDLLTTTQVWIDRLSQSFMPQTLLFRLSELKKCRDWIDSYKQKYGVDVELQDLQNKVDEILKPFSF